VVTVEAKLNGVALDGPLEEADEPLEEVDGPLEEAAGPLLEELPGPDVLFSALSIEPVNKF